MLTPGSSVGPGENEGGVEEVGNTPGPGVRPGAKGGGVEEAGNVVGLNVVGLEVAG